MCVCVCVCVRVCACVRVRVRVPSTKALSRLYRCTISSEPSLLAHVIRSWLICSNIKGVILTYPGGAATVFIIIGSVLLAIVIWAYCGMCCQSRWMLIIVSKTNKI